MNFTKLPGAAAAAAERLGHVLGEAPVACGHAQAQQQDGFDAFHFFQVGQEVRRQLSRRDRQAASSLEPH